jgi:serine/threonine protein phosphatase PrpC
MQEITFEKLQEEVRRADAERKEDQAKLNKHPPYDPNQRLRKAHHDDSGSVMVCDSRVTFLTFQNGKKRQEDFAGGAFVELNKDASIIERAVLLSNTIRYLSRSVKSFQSGSTLTATINWQADGKNHILVGNIGDSRAILYNHDAAENTEISEPIITRLTCDHSLLRENERQHFIARGYLLEELDNGDLNIKTKNGELIAEQLGAYLKPLPGSSKLQMTRSLGDTHYHKSSVFSYTPSFSYMCVPQEQRSYLLSCSDGITDTVSDEEICIVLGNHDLIKKNHMPRLQTIADLAIHRDSKDNVSIVINSLKHEIPEGQMRITLIADGHGGPEAANYIHGNFVKYFYQAVKDKRDYEIFIAQSKFMPREIRYLDETFKQATSGVITHKGAIDAITTFKKLEKMSKTALKLLVDLNYKLYPTSLQNPLTQFESGEITAIEAMSATIKVLRTIDPTSLDKKTQDFTESFRKKCDLKKQGNIDLLAELSVIVDMLERIKAQKAQKARAERIIRMNKR